MFPGVAFVAQNDFSGLRALVMPPGFVALALVASSLSGALLGRFSGPAPPSLNEIEDSVYSIVSAQAVGPPHCDCNCLPADCPPCSGTTSTTTSRRTSRPALPVDWGRWADRLWLTTLSAVILLPKLTCLTGRHRRALALPEPPAEDKVAV